jgi:opacity protein-like surface antigen
MGIGVGGMTTDTNLDVGSVQGKGTLRGGGGMFELLLGGTPLPGLVIGGAWVSHRFQEPRYESGGQSQTLSSSRLDMSLLGPFVQYYFDPTSGPHVQALVAVAEESFGFDDSTGSVETQQSSGFGFGAGAGWDFWVGDQWSLGLELRILHTRVKDTSTSENRQATTAGTLAFTATLH